ncbi:MAG: biotin--[acetyl-CoA-carboxylase] ligase [Nocardioides alkalitolerans]
MTEQEGRAPLRVEELADVPGAVGWRVEVVESSPSTNADLAARARDGAPGGLVLVAEHQTAGRGRIDRAFHTPARAALTFSVLLRPGVPAQHWPWLPLVTGLAARGALARLHGEVDVALKWPNDVLVAPAGRSEEPGKVAGILAERVDTPTGPAAVIGIGINTATGREELPVPTAASLRTVGVPVAAIDRTALLREVLTDLSALLVRWERGDLAGLRASYAAACATVGRRVRVELPQGDALVGDAVDVDGSGCLVVEADGRRHTVGAGDVIHVRPA